jgi:hypothetical protein
MNSTLHPDPGGHNASCPAEGTKSLLPHHLAELAASGLTPKTVAANSIYSETDPAAIAELLNWGTGRARHLGAVLVYPHCDRDRNPLGHATVKPDSPRPHKDKPGKVTKYENPYRRPNRLYVPAGARAALADPTAPLFVTEGCKKALTATQHGFACVSLPGVWNWVAPRETRDGKKVGRKELMPDLAAIPCTRRPVFVVFDSAAATNPDVARAERALAEALGRLGAVVRVVRLPTESDGAKNGLDDFLVRRGPDALRALLDAPSPPSSRPTPPAAVDPSEFTESGYKADRGWTFHGVLQRDKDTGELVVEKQMKLANFAARIVGVRVTDDGAEETHEFVIEAVQRGRNPVRAGVPRERFNALDW